MPHTPPKDVIHPDNADASLQPGAGGPAYGAPLPVLDYFATRGQAPRPLLHGDGKWMITACILVAVVIVPCVDFAVFADIGVPDHSPNLAHMFWRFAPPALYSMGAMLAALLWPERYGHHPMVRLGVATGIILAAQYLVLAILLTSDLERVYLELTIGCAASLACVVCLRQLAVIGDQLGGAALIVACVTLSPVLVMGCPLWALEATIAIQIRLPRGHGPDRRRIGFLCGAAGWLMLFACTWVWVVHG